jgi:hypothetical protein
MKYFKLVETYCLVKAVVSQAVDKFRKDATLQAVKMLEGKFELFCRSQFVHIKFGVTLYK